MPVAGTRDLDIGFPRLRFGLVFGGFNVWFPRLRFLKLRCFLVFS